MTTYNVWYMKPEFFRDGIAGFKWLNENKRLPSPLLPEETHVFL